MNQYSGVEGFLSERYQRHNARRLEHLASLCLPISGLSVLEVGAGIGDHTSFYLDRGCCVTVSDARVENLRVAATRFPEVKTLVLDLEQKAVSSETYELVHAYGVLYHTARPLAALQTIRALCSGILVLETCVSFGDDEAEHSVAENTADVTQSVSGAGCRPTRSWLFSRLKTLFDYVYITRSQPWHEEFPIDWRAAPPANALGLYRAVFVASRFRLDLSSLSDELLHSQVRL